MKINKQTLEKGMNEMLKDKLNNLENSVDKIFFEADKKFSQIKKTGEGLVFLRFSIAREITKCGNEISYLDAEKVAKGYVEIEEYHERYSKIKERIDEKMRGFEL